MKTIPLFSYKFIYRGCFIFYIAWEKECANYLYGIFVFEIWDEKEEET
jgi:hypothetical protein